MDRRTYHRQRMARRGLDEQTVKRDKDYINRVLKDSETVESVELANSVMLRPPLRLGSR